MKPIEFESQNIVYGVGQEGVEPLPALYDQESGTVLTVWEFSEEDIKSVIQTRKIILYMQTGGELMYPVDLVSLHENDKRANQS